MPSVDDFGTPTYPATFHVGLLPFYWRQYHHQEYKLQISNIKVITR
jgi:hypothetical protein